ncbi:MAG TPA: N,N-dimethylformamidase beta subunit family domain-containing protein [Caulifigura sp.]|nr:N,N-dimethylformamidase beta subunit family domain-containing protein [Caulifigura sp.]
MFHRSLTAVLTLALTFAVGPALTLADDLPPSLFIEGYASQVSYAPGEEVALHVSTSAPNFTLNIARLGADTKEVLAKSGLTGTLSPIPEKASSHGCNWPAAYRFTIPADWASGYYNIRFSGADNGGNFVARGKRTAESSAFFIVRPAQPGAKSKILLQLSTNTYNAYNNWNGGSLYGFHGRANLQGNRVSFLRPPRSQFENWERPFVTWAEKKGYALDYCANSDLEFHPDLLKSYRLVLSVGHDEYWSSPMRDNLEAFIGAGGNVAFFSGNTCCWQVRSEENGAALQCWKQWFNMDPVFRQSDKKLLSTLWSHHLVGRPENQLTGVGFLWGGYHKSHGQFMDGKGAFRVHHPEHWIYEGTGLKRDDEFGAKHTIVGYECDGCELTWKDGLPTPTYRDGTPKTFEILASCPAKWHPDDCEWYDQWEPGRVGNACLGVYTRGGTVFTCGSTDWAHGLRGGDETTERVTKNILDRLGK